MANYELVNNPFLTIPANTYNIESVIIRENLLLNNTAFTVVLKGNKRLGAVVNEIIKLIGNSQKLYTHTISALSRLYLKTHNWFYSTMRSQLLFKLNELHNNELVNSIVTNGPSDVQNESVFKFASIINLCLKEKKIDTKRAKELETIMESKKFEKIIPSVISICYWHDWSHLGLMFFFLFCREVAFILADPFVVDMLG